MLTEYSISWSPKENIEVILSLKSFWLGLKKKDIKNTLIKENKESNSVAVYCLGKLFKKNKLEVIFANEIRVHNNKEKIKFKKIFILFSKCAYNNNIVNILVNIIKIIGPDPEWKKFAKTIADNTK